MIEINTGKVVIIPDLESALNWADSIICKESDADYFIFLGDYTDARAKVDNITTFGESRTWKWINQKFEEYGDKIIWLCGNHDLIRVGNYSKGNFMSKSKSVKFTCSGWTRTKQGKFNRKINEKWVDNLNIFCKVGEYLVSHAGLHPYYLKEKTLEEMDIDWHENKRNLPDDHWAGDCGYSRGGSLNFGGPCWLDLCEFRTIEKYLSFPQIFGHNRVKKPLQIGKSFCIDSAHTWYGVWQNDEFTTKLLEEAEYKGFLEI